MHTVLGAVFRRSVVTPLFAQSLSSLEDRLSPGQLESDKDRLLLIQDKEQLLRELRAITPRSRSQHEMADIQAKIHQLQLDLNQALEMSNRCIADRY